MSAGHHGSPLRRLHGQPLGLLAHRLRHVRLRQPGLGQVQTLTIIFNILHANIVCVQRAVRPADGAVPVRGAAGGGAAVREVRGEHAHPPRRHRPALRALPPVLQPRAGATHNILLYNFSRPLHEMSYSSGRIFSDILGYSIACAGGG